MAAKNTTRLISEDLLKMLVCPMSGGRLELISCSEKEIDSATSLDLYCEKSCLAYPIENGVPILVPELAKQKFK
jgi:uncharacterized protein YbaR (Trm112 family)